jgi:hypothetical protein
MLPFAVRPNSSVQGIPVQVAQRMPTAVTIASQSDAVASRVQALLSTHRFRCYRTTDVQGEHTLLQGELHTSSDDACDGYMLIKAFWQGRMATGTVMQVWNWEEH